MDWSITLLIIFASLIFLMATGIPIAICFMIINLIGSFILFGGSAGLQQLIFSSYSSLVTFVLLPIPLFILMGELMFHSGIGMKVIDIVDIWLGRLPGRLSLLSVGAGTLLATLTGVSMASTSVLGSLLVPEMEKRGYKKSMSLGPILGSGGLALMIPPSALAVLLGAIGEIPISKLLMAIIIPGILMACFYATYIILRCSIQPNIAPAYTVSYIPFSKKIITSARYVLPIALIIFLVIGVIFLGIATPSEAAATGAIGVFFVAFVEGSLTWEVVKKSVSATLNVTGMVFLIIAGARAFSQILSFTGATQGMSEFVTELQISPIAIVICMQIVILILGGFMEVVAIMMLTVPVFMPIIELFDFSPVWFGTMVLLNIEMAMVTPPFGLCLFVMKGVATKDTTMADIYLAILPFLLCDLLVMAIIIAFPTIVLWIPGLMH